jgi:hypothetical protein
MEIAAHRDATHLKPKHIALINDIAVVAMYRSPDSGSALGYVGDQVNGVSEAVGDYGVGRHSLDRS